jgi:hypothetical protein
VPHSLFTLVVYPSTHTIFIHHGHGRTAAGIKARYRIFGLPMPEDMQGQFIDIDPMFSALYESMSCVTETWGDACIDGKWVVAAPAAAAEFSAAAGAGIIRFGEETMGRFFNVVPGTLIQPESVPRAARGLKVLKWLAPASLERMSFGLQKKYELGREIIEEAGGREAYDHKAREKMKLFSPVIEVEHSDTLVFEE